MKEDTHIFQGMRRDNHQIRQDGKFLWDAHNIRMTDREDSTFLSITNERGTSGPLITFKGSYVGHCVLENYLVVFTSKDDGSDNCIYRVEKTDTGYKTIILFHEKDVWKHSWSPSNPIEAFGLYETSLVQKVYWVDGVNQPRVINIAKPELKLPEEKLNLIMVDGIDFSDPRTFSDEANSTEGQTAGQELSAFYTENNMTQMFPKESFDFVRTLTLQESVDVEKLYGQGMFAPGTIQYAISYYDKYGQESNICYVTPLQYISPIDRGGSPEEKVANSFKIRIWGVDQSFEFVRIYSIQRTSIDAIPVVKIITDLSTKVKDPGESIDYIDTGTTGSTIDPTQLLYIGGESIVANSMTHKDNTLFLGNLSIIRDEEFENVKDILLEDYEVETYETTVNNDSTSDKSSYYDYTPTLTSSLNTMFMPGETYRCGLQVQYENGKWSEPIFVDDLELNNLHSWESYPLKVSSAIKIINGGQDPNSIVRRLLKKGVRRVRACIVYPNQSERNVICQGVLCPTVYSVSGRQNDNPYAMSSWFFRPAVSLDADNTTDVYHGASIEFQHNRALYSGGNKGAEIQNMLTGIDTLEQVPDDELDKYKSHFFVDENIVTMHSPDIEFDTSFSNYVWDNVRLRIIGVAKLGAISGDISLITSTPPVSPLSPGFIHNTIGYQTKNDKFINGGLVSGSFYRDYSVDSEFNTKEDGYWQVYPWHRSGSMNNDSRRPNDKGTQSAVLEKKIISNLKFFDKNTPLGGKDNATSPMYYNISTPKLFNSNELSVLMVNPSYLNKDVPYLGNIDTLITSGEYPIYKGASFNSTPVATTDKTTDPVRMKYKSTPHLVFSLGDSVDTIPLLPRHAAIGGTLNKNFSFPNWQQSGSSDGSNDDRGQYDYILALYADSYIEATFLPGPYEVGKCCIGRADNNVLYIVRCDETFTGRKWTKIYQEGLVLKVKARKTLIYDSDNNLPNTVLASDYDGNVYKGIDRYYKVHMIEEGSNACTIEDITSTVNSTNTTQTRATTSYMLSQDTFGSLDDRHGELPYLLIGELIRDNVINKFGGNSDEAKRQNLWVPAGRPVALLESMNDVVVPFEYGDTWYERYDCLKTYPFTQEDENKIVEIGSFMCETRVNIDGRYDPNRGKLSNLSISPINFNHLNEVYSQKDNFFNYRIVDEDYYKQHVFPNQITWSKEKHLGEETDTWTNVTLASTLDLNGEKGEITALKTWNTNLLCFQEDALSEILFNSRVQIPVTDGVPIEISNGYKVNGSRILSDNIGCSNKWSIVSSPTGLYFIDKNTDSIYVFGKELSSPSKSNGMSWWVRDNNPEKIWSPMGEGKYSNGIRTFYDSKYGDIYFTPGPVTEIDQSDALCYSEQLGQFVSQMSYGGTQAMFSFEDEFYSLREKNGNTVLYQNNVGEYNNFYGDIKGWDFSFISNNDPIYTKIFDTIELRTDHWSTGTLLNSFPMNYIKVDNEYQHTGTVPIDSLNMRKKFRVWRGIIPRAPKVSSYTSHLTQEGIDTDRSYGRSRIRNPWAMITMGWKPKEPGNKPENTRKAIIHDVVMKYTL